MLTPSQQEENNSNNIYVKNDILNIVKQNELKFQTLNTSINDINIKIAYCNEIATKVEQLFQFKSHTENMLSALSVRNDSLSKDIKDVVVKYDKIILDNLMYPGLIGNDCKYKTFHEFLNYIIQQLNEFIYYKDNNDTTLSNYKTKLDSVSKSISTRIDAIISSMKQFTTQSINDLNEKILSKLHSYDERLQEMRIENSKYTVQLKYQTANMLNEWSSVINMKDELISQFNQSNNKINETMKTLEQHITEYTNQYKQIKSKFVLVSNMLKNIKNGNDVIMKQHLIQMSNILNKENDNDINAYNKVLPNYKGGINAESFVKKYVKGEADINSMISFKHMNHSIDNKREINTMKRGTMFNLLNNKTMVNTIMVKHMAKDNNDNNNSEDNSLYQKENEKIIEDEFNKNNNNNVDVHNDIDKHKTEGTETICIYNSYKEYNQPNIINDFKKRSKKTGNNEDIYYITNNQANKVFDNNSNINLKQHNTIQIKKNAEDEYEYNENKTTENNINIISIANKNKLTKSNKGAAIQTSNKTHHNTNKHLSSDKINSKSKTRNDKSNSIKYKTLPYPPINFPRINIKTKNKSISKTSSESSFRAGNNITNGVLSNELTDYLHEIKAQLPKESMDIFYIKSIDKNNKTSRNSFHIHKQKDNNNATISPSVKAVLSNSMNQTLNDKNKDMKNNYYYNLMINDDNNLNVNNYTNRDGKGNSRSHKTIFQKLLNNKPKYVLNGSTTHKSNDLLNPN